MVARTQDRPPHEVGPHRPRRLSWAIGARPFPTVGGIGLVFLLACHTPPSAPPPTKEATATEQARPAQASDSTHEPIVSGPVPRDLPAIQQALATGHYAQAQRGLREVWPTQPTLDHWLTLARIHRLQGNLEASDDTLRQALVRIAPDQRCDIDVALANTAIARGRDDQAEQSIEACLQRQPHMAAALGLAVELARLRGGADEPVTKARIAALYDLYDRGQAKGDRELLAVARAALAGGSTGNFHDANLALTQAQSQAPIVQGTEVADEIALTLARLFAEKYNADDARSIAHEILARDPRHADTLALLAQIELSVFHLEQAEKAATLALTSAPHHADAHTSLAEIAMIQGDRQQALERVNRDVLSKQPHHRRALAVLAAHDLHGRALSHYQTHRQRALAHHPNDPLFFTTLADLLVSMHLYREADVVLRDAAARLPDDPSVQSAWGLNLLRLGQEESGRSAIDRAWARDRFNERTFNTRALYAETIGPLYSERTINGIVVRLPKQAQETIEPLLAQWLAQAKQRLDARYGISLAASRLEVFADPQAFSIRTTGVPDLGALGVCFGPVVTSVGPYEGTHNFFAVLWHELAHVYALQLSDGRVPRWFTEGLSEWETEVADPAWARESAELVLRSVRRGSVPKLDALELSFLRAKSAAAMEEAYATAAYAVRYLGETFGQAKIVALLRGFAQNHSFAELTARELGLSSSQVQQRFEAWLVRTLEQNISGWVPAQVANDPREKTWLALEAAKSDGDRQAVARLIGELQQRGGDGAPLRLHEAGLYLAQEQLAAAKGALEKVLAFDRTSVPALAKLAHLAQAQDNLDEEAQWLRRVLKIDAMSFDPAARLYALALILGWQDDLAATSARMQSIAPLHPMALLARLEHGARTDDHVAVAALRPVVEATLAAQHSPPPELFAVAALVFQHLRQPTSAGRWAKLALASTGGLTSPRLRQALIPHF